MTKPSNIDAIATATETPWDEWLNYLDKKNAKNLSHKEIAELAYAKLKASHKSAGWWSQSVALAYEQCIGRRQPGQRSDGTYEISVTRTMGATLDSAMQSWLRYTKGKQGLSGSSISQDPTSTKTPRRLHWGCNLQDGTRVNVDLYQKTPEKVLFSISHIRLLDSEAADERKKHWKSVVKEL